MGQTQSRNRAADSDPRIAAIERDRSDDAGHHQRHQEGHRDRCGDMLGEPDQSDARHRAQHGSQHRRATRDDETVDCGAAPLPAGEEELVPSRREPYGRKGDEIGCAEGDRDDDDRRQQHETADGEHDAVDRPVDDSALAGQCHRTPHTARKPNQRSPAQNNANVVATSTSDNALAKPQLSDWLMLNSINCARNMSRVPPRIAGMTKKPRLSVNTSISPAMTPGSVSGRYTFRNSDSGRAPRLRAARRSSGLTRIIVAASGRIR